MSKIAVVVLGDIGRSPRMQYHSLSLAEEGFKVSLIGYSGSQPLEKLTSHPNVSIQHISSCPEFKNYMPTLLAYMLKVLWQSMTLLAALFFAGFPHHVLVQNPPSVPSLGVCYVFCKVTRARFMIDWHNYGYTILALSLHPQHTLVKISKWFEFFFGRRSDSNICVTAAMKEDLMKNYGIRAVVFYDRPPDIFKKISVEEKHWMCLKLGYEYEVFLKNRTGKDTVLTEVMENGKVRLKEKRPGMVVSSTSWTEDEDFSVLLEALLGYDEACAANDSLPNLICAITGKGPLKEFYLNIIRRKELKHVVIITPWLEAEDYPVFLGCADIGVSLHTSSSGLDLPMKVVDMFGCHVPVCAITFQCISELVKHNHNGFVFSGPEELSRQLQTWFSGFPTSTSEYSSAFSENLAEFNTHRWHDTWKLLVLPLLQAD